MRLWGRVNVTVVVFCSSKQMLKIKYNRNIDKKKNTKPVTL